MTPTQRTAALRLAQALENKPDYVHTLHEAAALLRELAAEPTEPVIDGYPLLQGIPPPQRQPLSDEALREELERCRADAERYRWLRSEHPLVAKFWDDTAADTRVTLEIMDAAIDAARARETP